MKSMHGFNSINLSRVDWVIPNDLGIEDNSLLPQMVEPAMDYLRRFGFFDKVLVFYLRPAFYLYILIYCSFIMSLRFRDWKAWIASFPSLIQAAVLFLINFVPAFRYLYSNLLVGVFAIGLLFIFPRKAGEEEQKENQAAVK